MKEDKTQYNTKDLKNIIKILLNTIKREGIQQLIKYLEESDYYTAPASTKYHLSEEAGLIKHSYNVYKTLKELTEKYKLYKIKEETIIICGLLHDICKVNNYKKIEENKYIYENKEVPLDHGVKSIAILQKYIKLTNEELCAIRYHMNAWETGIHFGFPTGYSFNKANEKYILVSLLFISDMIASKIIEKEETK